jgi:hypothetical protein
VLASASDWPPVLSLAGAARLGDEDERAREAKRSDELEERRMVSIYNAQQKYVGADGMEDGGRCKIKGSTSEVI